MSVTIEKNQGVRLALAASGAIPLHHPRETGGYYKVRSYHGGGEFFEAENAQVILQCLGEFLPRALERTAGDGRQEIFYQHLINGQDVCSSSAPLDSGMNVPPSELARLEAALAQFKAKETDPSTDPTKREIIRAFRLPNPQKDPELYRLYGSGSNRRLLVLWGIEREAGSSLPPQEALSHMPLSKRRSAWWYSLFLLPLLILLAWWWWEVQRPADSTAEPLSEASKPIPMSVPSSEAGTTDSPDAANGGSGSLPSSAASAVPPSSGLAETSAETANPAAKPTQPQRFANPENKKPDTSKPDTSKPDTSKPDTSKPDTSKPDTSKPDTSKPDTSKPDTSKPDTSKPDTNKPDTNKPDTNKPDTNKPDTNKPDTNKPDTNKPDTNKPDTNKPDTNKPDTNKPDTNKPDTNKQAPPASNESLRSSNPQPEATPSPVSTVEPEVDPKLERPATDENPANIPDEVPTSDAKKTSEPTEPTEPSEPVAASEPLQSPETSPSTLPSTQPSVEPPALAVDQSAKDSDPPQPAATPGSATSPKLNGAPTPKMPPLSAEIVNTRTSAAPKNGKVEMQISMLARDADGNAVAISKMESWSINGKTQNDETGRPIIANGLPVNLTEGVHRVRASGSTADGRLVSAVAEVNVDFVVRQEASVQVKQVEKPKP